MYTPSHTHTHTLCDEWFLSVTNAVKEEEAHCGIKRVDVVVSNGSSTPAPTTGCWHEIRAVQRWLLGLSVGFNPFFRHGQSSPELRLSVLAGLLHTIAFYRSIRVLWLSSHLSHTTAFYKRFIQVLWLPSLHAPLLFINFSYNYCDCPVYSHRCILQTFHTSTVTAQSTHTTAFL